MKTKICTKCGKEKEISEFVLHKGGKFGVSSRCKYCDKQWRENNIERRKSWAKRFYEINKERLKVKNKQYNKQHNKQRGKKKSEPWIRTLKYIKQRCNYSKHKSFKYYGGRGIKCLITSEELKFLWFRDKGYEMKKPSIDHKENNENYTLDNCQYIELIKNINKNKKWARP